RVESGDVHGSAYVRVADVDVLEAAVTPEAVDDVGADPATDPCRPFEDTHRDSGLLQRPRAGESGDPGANHGHVGGVHCWSIARSLIRYRIGHSVVWTTSSAGASGKQNACADGSAVS